MDRVIFLDIDGVLNSTAFFIEREARRDRGNLPPEPVRGANSIDRDAVATLNELCLRADARIVVSSTWRLGTALADLRGLLSCVGLRGRDRIIGTTPDLSVPLHPGKLSTSYTDVPRGKEIAAWLDEHSRRPFVILDDDADMCELTPWLVRTDHEVGLQPEHVEQALAILQKEATW